MSGRISRRLKRACAEFGAGKPVTIDVIVSSTGTIGMPSVSNTSPQLRQCLTDRLRSDGFRPGKTRRVSITVRF